MSLGSCPTSPARTNSAVRGPEGFQLSGPFCFSAAFEGSKSERDSDEGTQITTVDAGALVALLLRRRAAAAPDPAPALAGRWDATVVVNGGRGAVSRSRSRRRTTAQGIVLQRRAADHVDRGQRRRRRADVQLRSVRDQVAAKVADGRLTGEYQRGTGRALSVPGRRAASTPRQPPSTRRRSTARGSSARRAPRARPRGASSRKQTGAQVSATILRVDGDTGTLTGSYRDGRFVLSHFSGARPLLLEVTPAADGTLRFKQNGKTELVAAREGAAARRRHSARRPTRRCTRPSRIRRSRSVSASRTSQGKSRQQHRRAVPRQGGARQHQRQLVPELPRRGAVSGLALSQVPRQGTRDRDAVVRGGRSAANPTRLRAFIETYGLEYTVLLPGEPDAARSEGAAGGQPQRVSDDVHPRPRWPRARPCTPGSRARAAASSTRRPSATSPSRSNGCWRKGMGVKTNGAMAKWQTRRPAKPLFEGSIPSRLQSSGSP